MDRVKDVMASAVRHALSPSGFGNAPPVGHGLVSWRHETTKISALETLIKVWPEENRPPRYFIVKVSEQL